MASGRRAVRGRRAGAQRPGRRHRRRGGRTGRLFGLSAPDDCRAYACLCRGHVVSRPHLVAGCGSVHITVSGGRAEGSRAGAHAYFGPRPSGWLRGRRQDVGWVNPAWGSVGGRSAFYAIHANVSAAERRELAAAHRCDQGLTRENDLLGWKVVFGVCRPAGRRSLRHCGAEARVKRPEQPQAHGSPDDRSWEGCRLTRGTRIRYPAAGRWVAPGRRRRAPAACGSSAA
jgi:hypothetical protein